MKTIAESTQLTTFDAQAVLDKLLSTLIVPAARGVRIRMPPALFHAFRSARLQALGARAAVHPPPMFQPQDPVRVVPGPPMMEPIRLVPGPPRMGPIRIAPGPP